MTVASEEASGLGQAGASGAAFEGWWQRSASRIGVPTLLATAVLCLLPNLVIYLQYGAFPGWDAAFAAWGMVLANFGAFYLVEPISYYPVLGLAGSYMSFLAGNIANMRLPCSAVAQEVVGVEPNTPEAEIVAVLGIAGSIVTNMLFLALAALGGYGLLQHVPATIQAGFRSYAGPAIFGAVFGQFALRYPKLAAFALLIAVSLKCGSGFRINDAVVVVASVFGTIVIGRVLYVRQRSSKAATTTQA